MDNRKLKLLTLGTLFAMCGCQFTPNSVPSTNSSPQVTQYTVTWVVDGETTQETYAEGETPTYKFTTEKEADETYTYTFVGWDKEIVPVVADVTYTAEYEQTYIDYLVTWVVEGVETQETYHYNDMPTYKGETPTKEGDAQYSYTFTGWDKEVVAVTQDVTYTAQFEQSINEYTVTWVVEDVRTEETYKYGDMPTYKGETPSKTGDAQYTYTFTGWDKDIVAVTKNTVYRAQFSSAVNKYTVNFYDADGTTVLYTSEFEYGAVPTFEGETPSKSVEGEAPYTFVGWENKDTKVIYDGELPEVNGVVNYCAKYYQDGENVNVKVKMLNLDGTLIEEKAAELPFNELYTYEAPAVEGKVANYDYVKGVIGGANETIEIHYSELAEWDGITVSGSLSGEGTEANPYIIASGADLAYIRDEVAKYTEENPVDFEGKYFKVTHSIDLSNAENFRIGGTEDHKDENMSFAGILDGNNCSIRGLNINDTLTRSCLFFSIKATGSVSNLSIYGTSNGGQYAGTVVGRLFGTLSNIVNYATVTYSGANAGGGIAGGMAGNSVIENCINYGTVTNTDSRDKTAGIVAAGEKGTIRNCVNYGDISANKIGGGIVANAMDASMVIENCVNYGNVTTKGNISGGIAGQCNAMTVRNLVNYGDVYGVSRVGGVIGNNTTATADVGITLTNLVNYGDVENGGSNGEWTGGIIGVFKFGTVSNSVNYGNVSGTGRSVGGIVGVVATGGNVTINNCENYGDISGTKEYVGGISGGPLHTKAGTLTVAGCTNYGNITGPTKVGGIVGYIKDGEVTDCVNHGTITATNTPTEEQPNVYYGEIIGSDERPTE